MASDRPRHWVVLGTDALRRIGVKLDMQDALAELGLSAGVVLVVT